MFLWMGSLAALEGIETKQDEAPFERLNLQIHIKNERTVLGILSQKEYILGKSLMRHSYIYGNESLFKRIV